MSAAGVFVLDDDQEGEASSSPSPRHSPPLITRTSRSSPSTSSQTSGSSTLQISQASQTPLLSPLPLPFGQHRKHTTHAAMPSFPSPLAQAMTVPATSDTSSSSSHSSDDEIDQSLQDRASPLHSPSSGTPKRTQDHFSRPRASSPRTDRSTSPASTQQSNSQPPSPIRPQVLTPSALLMRSKRSSGGSVLPGSLPSSVNSNQRDHTPDESESERADSLSPVSSRTLDYGEILASESLASADPSSGTKGSDGTSASPVVPGTSEIRARSSPPAFGIPELDSGDEMPRLRGSNSGISIEDRTGNNVLGLGLAPGWESSMNSDSSSSKSKDKGKSKDAVGPTSSRRERERTAPGALLSR